MEKRRAAVIIQMDPPPGREKEWNKWYNEDHIPSRLALPGYLAIRRFELAPGLPGALPAPKYLSVVELESLAAFENKDRVALAKKEAAMSPTSFEVVTQHLPNRYGGVYEQIFPEQQDYIIPDNAKFLFAVAHDGLPPEILDEYSAWYATEHIPAFMKVPGVISARRFAVVGGARGHAPDAKAPGPQFAGLFDLANDKFFETAEFKTLNNSPWSMRMGQMTRDKRKIRNLYKSFYVAKQ